MKSVAVFTVTTLICTNAFSYGGEQAQQQQLLPQDSVNKVTSCTEENRKVRRFEKSIGKKVYLLRKELREGLMDYMPGASYDKVIMERRISIAFELIDGVSNYKFEGFNEKGNIAKYSISYKGQDMRLSLLISNRDLVSEFVSIIGEEVNYQLDPRDLDELKAEFPAVQFSPAMRINSSQNYGQSAGVDLSYLVSHSCKSFKFK